MRRVCLGCGSEIPEDSDFCYACGRWAKDALSVDDKGNLLVTEYCLNCGEAMPANSAFCPYCGNQHFKGIKYCPGCGIELPSHSAEDLFR